MHIKKGTSILNNQPSISMTIVDGVNIMSMKGTLYWLKINIANLLTHWSECSNIHKFILGQNN